ncbi:acyl-coenzyme A thioesterase THEM4-like isoform 3-T5 [Vipera latastei]
MQSILRSVNQAVKGMAPRIPGLARRKELLVQPPPLLLRRTSTQPHQCLKDLGVPNSSWSPEMMGQFQKFTKLSEDGSWQRIPSYMTASAEGHQKPDSQNGERRLFVQSIGEEGMGFEHAVFMNPSEKRAVTLFQPGPYLEGPVGFANGGAIIAIVEHTVGASIASIDARVTSININYKRPVALGSVVLVEARADRTEGRKVFVNFEVRSVDGQTLYAQGIVLCVKVQPPSSPQKETDPSSSP